VKTDKTTYSNELLASALAVAQLINGGAA